MMKLFRITVLIATLSIFMAISVFADDAKTTAKKETPKELKNQTNCPVMGGKIDSTVYTDIQGQRVYHCCPGCSKPMQENPDKFFKKAAKDGVLFENIQTTCPVSGEKLDKEAVFADFEGRRVYFCCEKCIGMFEKDAQTYLTKIDAPVDDKKSKKVDHSGHNH